MNDFLVLLLIPGVTERLDLVRFNENRLLEHGFLSLPDAVVYYSFDHESDMSSLKDNVCRFFAPYALLLCIKKGNYGFGHHLGNKDWNLTSPRGMILPNQKKKKKPKPVICVDPEALIKAFPKAEGRILNMYLRPGVEKKGTEAFFEEYSEELVFRNEQYYVREDDRFPVGDPRQAFDFLRYLGYEMPGSVVGGLSE
ncbi:MAG: hypothetical protein K2J79_04160 [Ruminiclostridium sp.]|nr:hypothetical protein [Ruminiclostridium sp.]